MQCEISLSHQKAYQIFNRPKHTDDLTKMVRIRNKNWLENDDLKADLTKYVHEDLSHSEILDFVRQDYSIYA